MATRNIQGWYKFAFQLLVNEQWNVIAERVENGDQTYRWVKEQLLLAIRDIERENWETLVAATAFDIKMRLESFKNSFISEENCIEAQHWLRRQGGLCILRDMGRFSTKQKVLGTKLGLLEASLANLDEPRRVSAGICSLFNLLTEVDDVVNAIYENTDPKLAYEVKVMYDLSKEYAQSLKIPLDNLVELEFAPSCLPTEPPPVFTPPDIWVFGDYGYEDGQLHSPGVVHVDKEGNFLVMDQDITGKDVPQRIQLFNPLGKFIKVILRRGSGNLNGMRDFCLNKSGNIIVADTDDNDDGRVRVFDYDGNQLMVFDADKANPEISYMVSLSIDDDDNLICADMRSATVWVYSPDGKVISKFGKRGREEENFMSLLRVHTFDKKIYTFSHGIHATNTKIFDYNGSHMKTLWPNYLYKQLVFHKDGQIYAVRDHHIDKIDLEGNQEVVAGKDGGFGSYIDEFFHLNSIEFLPDGRLVTAESGNNRIKVFKL